MALSLTDLKEQTNSARNSNASAHLQHVDEYEWLIGFHNLTLPVCVHLTLTVFTTACHLPILWVKSSSRHSTQFFSRSILIISILFSAFWWWCAMVWCTGSLLMVKCKIHIISSSNFYISITPKTRGIISFTCCPWISISPSQALPQTIHRSSKLILLVFLTCAPLPHPKCVT